MSTIADYNSLKSAIQVWAARPDSVFGNQIPVFVEMAEARLYDGAGQIGDEIYSPPLRSSVMETTASIAMTDGVGYLPANALEIRRIYQSGDLRGLTYAPPERFKVFAANNSAAADGIYYTVEGGQISVAPADSSDIVVNYFMRHPAITTSQTTGPLLSEHGTIYLAACLFEAFSFMQEGQLAGAHLARLRSMVAGANRTASTMRMPSSMQRVRVRNSIP
jgi:hypothetical protein